MYTLSPHTMYRESIGAEKNVVLFLTGISLLGPQRSKTSNNILSKLCLLWSQD